MPTQNADDSADIAIISQQKELIASEREYHKSLYEYLRYFSTLGTASIVAVGAFMGRLTDRPTWKGLAVASVLAFLVSVIASTIVYTGMIVHFPGRGTADPSDKHIKRIALMTTWISFLAAIACLAVFVVKNLGN